MRKYGSIDEIAKEYALTNEQLRNYLLLNDIDSLSDLDKINLDDKDIIDVLDKINGNRKLENNVNSTSSYNILVVKTTFFLFYPLFFVG